MGCMKCIKYLVFTFNLLFWICGMAILGLAIYLRLDKTSLTYVSAADQSVYFIGCYVLMGAGGLMTIIGFLGCCGAYHEHRCMLTTFFCFLLVILVAEVAAGVYAYTRQAQIEEELVDVMQKFVKIDYGHKNSFARTDSIDKLQKEMECCGAYSHMDYINSTFEQGNGISRHYPDSCCGDDKCSVPFDTGCGAALLEWFKDNLMLIMIVAFSVAGVEVIGMVLSMVLCCLIHNRYKGYKA